MMDPCCAVATSWASPSSWEFPRFARGCRLWGLDPKLKLDDSDCPKCGSDCLTQTGCDSDCPKKSEKLFFTYFFRVVSGALCEAEHVAETFLLCQGGFPTYGRWLIANGTLEIQLQFHIPVTLRSRGSTFAGAPSHRCTCCIVSIVAIVASALHSVFFRLRELSQSYLDESVL